MNVQSSYREVRKSAPSIARQEKLQSRMNQLAKILFLSVL